MNDERMVPDTIKDLWLDHEAAVDLRDTYVKRPFGFKKALRASRLAIERRDEFWDSLKKLYPELGENLILNRGEWTISKKTV